MIRPEDRMIVIDVAVEIFCARIQANAGKFGYSPDMDLCVGEAAALVSRVDSHAPPNERRPAMRLRRRSESIELNFKP